MGTLPTQLAQLSNLRLFHMGYTQVSGTIPTPFMQLPQLESLYVHRVLHSSDCTTHSLSLCPGTSHSVD